MNEPFTLDQLRKQIDDAIRTQGKELDRLKSAINEIENAMERWHHARDEDGETLQKINDVLLELGKLEWVNKP